MTIEQISRPHLLGGWTLHTPDDKILKDERGIAERTISPFVGGTYSLTVDPPQRARTNVTIYEGDDVIRRADATSIAFTVSGVEAVRVVITFRFFGSIAVTSDPEGELFTLKGPEDSELTGTTPAIFHGLPPYDYVAEFDQLTGCRRPQNQQRVLEPNGSVTFHGVYFCGRLGIGDLPAEEEIIAPPAYPRASLRPNQYEVLPGGTISYTLTVENPGKSTAENITVSVQFDPAQGMVTQMRDGGIIRGNLMVWEVPPIFSGRRWSTTFTYKVHDDLAVGDRITMSTRMEAEGLVEAGMPADALTQSVGVTLLPETGWKNVLLLAALLNMAALIFAFTISQKRHVLPTV
ncbi:MAG: DUF11 domain-containing protein [Deltaproteobacteria bacterium]|nr:DUF11 domain-containing protein [Deltaproteobacteria bacterium]